MKYLMTLMLILGTWTATFAEEETLTKAEVEKLVREEMSKLKFDMKITKFYLDASTNIKFCIRCLKLLRSSDSTKDPKVKKVIEQLEMRLDNSISSFFHYSKEKETRWHPSIIKTLNQARRYRKEHPQQRKTEVGKEVGIFFDKLFLYAKAEEKKLSKAQQRNAGPAGPN